MRYKERKRKGEREIGRQTKKEQKEILIVVGGLVGGGEQIERARERKRERERNRQKDKETEREREKEREQKGMVNLVRGGN